MRRLSLAICLCLLLGVGTAAFGNEAQELDRVKKRLEEERKNLNSVLSKKKSVLDLLEDLEVKHREAVRADKRATEDLETLEKSISETQTAADQKQADLASLRSRFHERLIRFYKWGDLAPVRILFGAESASDLTFRAAWLKSVLREDRTRLMSFEKGLEELTQLRAELAKKQQEISQQRIVVMAQRDQLMIERGKKQALAQAITHEEKIRRRYISELEEASERLEKLMKELRERKKKEEESGSSVDRGFAARKGSLPTPVRGRIISRFGRFRDPKFNTVRFQKGIEIAAEHGASVRASYAGSVVFSGAFKGFGQMLIVDHGGGYYTLLSRNQELLKRTGDSVSEGEVVARLPTTAESGLKERPVFYFEVRHHSSSVDPMEWLSPSSFL